MSRTADPSWADAFARERYPMGEDVNYELFVLETYKRSQDILEYQSSDNPAVLSLLPDATSLREVLTNEAWTPWYGLMLNSEVSANSSIFRMMVQQLFREAVVSSMRRQGENAPINAVLNLALADVFDDDDQHATVVSNAIRSSRIIDFSEMETVHRAFREFFSIDIPDDDLTHDIHFLALWFDAAHGGNVMDTLIRNASRCGKRSLMVRLPPGDDVWFTRRDAYDSAEAMLRYLRRIESLMVERHLTSATAAIGAPPIAELPTRGIARKPKRRFGVRPEQTTDRLRFCTVDWFEEQSAPTRLRLDFQEYVIETVMSCGGPITPPPWVGIATPPRSERPPKQRQRSINELMQDDGWIDRFAHHLYESLVSLAKYFSLALQELIVDAAIVHLKREGSNPALSDDLGISTDAITAPHTWPRTMVCDALETRIQLDFSNLLVVEETLQRYFSIAPQRDDVAQDVLFAQACANLPRHIRPTVTEQLSESARELSGRTLKPSIEEGEVLRFTPEEISRSRNAMLTYLHRLEAAVIALQ